MEIQVVLETIAYSVIGIIIMISSIILFDRAFKLELHKELVEEHNTAFGLVIAGMSIAIAIIIASSIHG
jgi:uncharacterized membrane protein YjfL (UPF0719 family)